MRVKIFSERRKYFLSPRAGLFINFYPLNSYVIVQLSFISI